MVQFDASSALDGLEMKVDANAHKSCDVSYTGSYLYETFSGSDVQPKLKNCSRPALKDGKCILHAGKQDDPIDLNRRDAFDQALLDEVKALGVPLVRKVDFSSYNFGFLDEIVDAVMKASGTRTAKFDGCIFPSGVFLGNSSVSVGFYDCHFGGVQFAFGEESPSGYEFFQCNIEELEADNKATFTFLNLHGSHINNVAIRVVADSVSLRGAYIAGRLEINSSTIRTLDLAYLSVEDWAKVNISNVTHPLGVRVSAVGSALNDATFYGVDLAQRDKGGLILADEEAIKNPALEVGANEQFKPEACQVLTSAAVAQTYRNFIDVFERTRQYDLAEECFVAAMDVQSEDAHLSRTHRAAIHLYDRASRYGSSYVRASFVLVLLIGIFMSLYSLPPTSVRLVDTKQNWRYTGTSGFMRRLGGGALHSIEVATFLKNPLYETYTPTGKIVEAAEIVIVPAQAALLLFAIRRRFKR
jgi:hypothetical protein